MLIVVMMGACCVVHNVRLYSLLDTVDIYGCSVLFGTLVGVLPVLCGLCY